MKNEKGVTLIALAIMIVVLTILASVTVSIQNSTYESTQFRAFITELEMMQTQVNDWNQRYNNGDKSVLELGKSLTNSGIEDSTFSAVNITDKSGYRYFDKETLTELGFDAIRREFLINVEQRKVICFGGYEYENTTYYTIEQVPNSLYNVEYKDKTTGNIVIGNVYVEAGENNSWNVYIQDVQYPNYISKGKIEYQKDGKNYWNLVTNNEFSVDEPGIYYIRITDANGNTNIVDKDGNTYTDNKIPVYIYSKNGLLLDLDATQNTRVGQKNNATTWEDLSGNNIDATLKNFDMTSSSGWQTNSLKFDGINDYAIINNSDLLKITDQTVEVVIKKNAIVNNDRSIFFVKWPGYTMEFYANNTVVYGRNDGGYLAAKTSTTLGKIYNITGSHSNNVSTIYINGTNENTQSVTPKAFGDTNLTIGNYNNNYFLNGEIYQIRMYNRKLSDDEIKTHYIIDQQKFDIK